MLPDDSVFGPSLTMTIVIQRAVYSASLVERDGQLVSCLDVHAALDGLAAVAAMLLEALPATQTPMALRLAGSDFTNRVEIAAQELRDQFERTGSRMIDGSSGSG